jgi:hypothetical protein
VSVVECGGEAEEGGTGYAQEGAFPEWWDDEVGRFLPTQTGECF